MTPRFLLSLMLLVPALHAAGVKVQFDPSKPEIGPFPTDFLTAPATNTRTAKRVRLPQPADCSARPNDCQEAWLLNDFDGFNPQARVRVKFSGPINPETLKEGVLLVARENLTQDEPGVHKDGDVIRLNQIVYDSTTNTAYGKPDTAMDQHRRYLLVVTEAVKDLAGDPVESDDAFAACAGSLEGYCGSLVSAIFGITVNGRIAAASVFSTMSATAWLEKARDQLTNVTTAVTPNSGRSLFNISEFNSLTFRQQVRTSPSTFEDLSVPTLLLLGVRAAYFGSYSSPNYLSSGRTIEAAPSAGDLPPAPNTAQVDFHSFLPSGTKPASGYPVVIYGHGLGDSRFGAPTLLGPVFAGDGMATIAISAVGHGYGPGSALVLGGANPVTIPAPGRGVDLNNDGRIESNEGCAALASSPFGLRDCLRQTAVDILQLVRVIRAGLDVDGDGVADFDPERIYYAGQSLGSLYGTMLLAVEPNLKAAVLNSGGGSVIELSRWSLTLADRTAQNLRLRLPSLPAAEEYVLRNQPVKVVSNPAAIESQNALEMLEWIQAEGDPASFAVHLKPTPLPGVAEKRILWQFAWGDRTVPNPSQSALIRYANMKDSTWVYRNDKARAAAPTLPLDPHTYLTDFTGISLVIARATQSQMSGFLSTDGVSVRNPNNGLTALLRDIFEQPETLPEELNYLEK